MAFIGGGKMECQVTKRRMFVVFMISICVLMLMILSANVSAKDLPFLHGNTLYKSSPDNSSLKAAIATHVARILQYHDGIEKILYIAEPKNGSRHGDLWISNVPFNETTPIAEGVIDAQFSPDGKTIVLWNKDHQIHVVTDYGKSLEQVGVHGAAPIFSHNGQFIAYEKLADISFDEDEQSLFEFAQGIAIYDLVTRQETLLTQTEHGEDYAPIAFSSDLKRVYFNSTRRGIASVWSVNTDGSDLRQITNARISPTSIERKIPALSQTALWASHRLMAISSLDGEIWLFRFTVDGNLSDAKFLTWGEFPLWLVPDQVIALRPSNKKNEGWQVIHIQ